MSSWAKVALGARLVASAVSKQTAEEAAVATQRAAHHGFELSTRARHAAAVAMSEVWVHPMTSEAYTDNAYGSSDSDSSSAGTSPYESQLRKKRQREQSQDVSNKVQQQNSAEIANAADLVHTDGQIEWINSDPIPNPYLLHAQQPLYSTLANSGDAPPKEKVLSEPAKDSPSPTPFERSMDVSETTIRIPKNESHPDPEPPSSPPIRMREGRAVPSSRVGRAVGFASLGVGLVWGAASEWASRVVQRGKNSNGDIGEGGTTSSVAFSNANADRLAATLCRMRGAALKMGQMLSIQDEALLPPALTRALNQVRQGADAMPNYQLLQQLESQLGKEWRDKFETFDELPFAAASIGQVHRATIRDPNDGTIHDVVVKVQYPGVANSIESDLRNVTMLISFSGLAPKGMFLDNVVRVGRDELKVECNYLNELANQEAFKELVDSDPYLRDNNFIVPNVFPDLTTEQIIVTEFAPGGTIDKVKDMDQEERNRIGRGILYLTMQELFVWRLMQTDPNWGNFLYDVGTRQTALIDFGATREYSKEFVDGYLRIVWANANRDEATLMDLSHKMGFLTGEENELMKNAHKQSGFTVGEPFATDEPFDFQGSQISSRMSEHTSAFLQHRLTPPPEEVYTLHRKLAGAFMLCIKVGAIIRCRDLLEDIVRNYQFDDGLPHPMSK